ncbi:MAG TPA: IS1595 family transposase [Hyphomonadaceae bacterium]|jgi:transposase-like protein|nr:IS1595 family transposase [Hyphomonadaceae bacterium]
MTAKIAELQKPIYNDEVAAQAHFEKVRWPQGPVCFHCGSDNVTRMSGKTVRTGLFQCNEKECRGQFTAVMGTVFEKSHIPLHKWLMATHLLCSSKKGMSASQLHRELGFGSYRTAWFMAHRIREAMKPGGDLPPLGGPGKVVEADETYYGKAEGRTVAPKGTRGKRKVNKNSRSIVALVERGGNVRTFHVGSADQWTVENIIIENVSPDTHLATDESRLYTHAGELVFNHDTVKHSAGEYVRDWVHTNSLEGYFSIFKRGMRGIYQHCAEKHLHRYLAEYDFRYNYRIALGFNDNDRTDAAIAGTVGKRLTYRRTHAA